MYLFKVLIAHAQASLLPHSQKEIFFQHSSIEDSSRLGEDNSSEKASLDAVSLFAEENGEVGKFTF